jgi:diphthamide biosynthesis protein 4
MTEPQSLTHYQVLNISQEASSEEIKAAFRQLALEKHPDKNPLSCEDDFRRIQQAWECLRDSRQVYDDELRRESMRIQSKTESAMAMKLSEMEEAVDDETNSVVYIYACRCGGEVEVWPEVLLATNEGPVLLECPGCSFAYAVEK